MDSKAILKKLLTRVETEDITSTPIVEGKDQSGLENRLHARTARIAKEFGIPEDKANELVTAWMEIASKGSQGIDLRDFVKSKLGKKEESAATHKVGKLRFQDDSDGKGWVVWVGEDRGWQPIPGYEEKEDKPDQDAVASVLHREGAKKEESLNDVPARGPSSQVEITTTMNVPTYFPGKKNRKIDRYVPTGRDILSLTKKDKKMNKEGKTPSLNSLFENALNEDDDTIPLPLKGVQYYDLKLEFKDSAGYNTFKDLLKTWSIGFKDLSDKESKHTLLIRSTDFDSDTVSKEFAKLGDRAYLKQGEEWVPIVGPETGPTPQQPFQKSVWNENMAVLNWDDYEELTPEAKEKWQGYRYKMAYDIVTPESAEEGDFDENGWEVEDSDKFNSLGELLDEVGGKMSGGEWSSYPTVDPAHDWITSSDGEADYETGARKSYSLWIERVDGKLINAAELEFINKELHIHGNLKLR